MLKSNPFFWLFLVCSCGLLFSLLCISYKYLPFVIYSTINSCQGMVTYMSELTMRHLGLLILSITGIGSLFVIKRGIALWWSLRVFEKKSAAVLLEIVVPSRRNLVEKLELCGMVKVIRDEQPRAFCLGIWRPSIYVSTGLLQLMSVSELEAILRHEKSHLENFDTITQALGSWLRVFSSIFPSIPELVAFHRLQQELTADQASIVSMGSSRPLASALKKMLRYEFVDSVPLATALAEYETLEIRIAQLFKGPQKLHFSVHVFNMVASSGVAFLLFGLVVFPVQAIAVVESDNHILWACRGEHCSNFCTGTSVSSDSVKINASYPFTPVWLE